MLGNRATFPVAVHEGSLALWPDGHAGIVALMDS